MFKTAIIAASGLMLALVGTGPSPSIGNGPPNQTGGSDLNAFQEADNFTLAGATHVSQVTFWSLQTNASDYAGSTDWSFNADNMGAPGTVLFSGNSVAVGVATGNSTFGLTEFAYTFSVSVDLPAGNYWLVLHNGPSAAIPTTTCYWAWSADTGDSQSSDLLAPAWVTNSAELAFQLTTSASVAPTTTCQTISGAVQGYAITPVTMTGSGGSGAPYTFSATGLPNGLGISSGGTISGTPTVNGTFNYTVTVTDSGTHTGSVNCSVTVNPPPTSTCQTISGAVQGFAITPVTMTGSGGVGGPYAFSATGLPNGLGISSGGTISGTPTVNGTFNYTVTVTDSASHSGNVNCSVAVNPPPTANCVTISNAVQGYAITPVTMTGSGGVGGAYTFSATGLPNGLGISSGGTISGTPTVNGTFNYTVTVTDSASHSGNVNCSVTVNPPPTANCVTISNAVQGVAITPVTMTGSGGSGSPYTFSATGLPNGLGISAGGTISGTPTVNGTFNYTVTVTDSASHQGTVQCSVTVSKASPSVSTTASGQINLGNTISDMATVSGGFNPTGTITFRLFGPNDANCGGTVIFTSAKTVNGNGSYTSGSFMPTAVGTYRFVASYGGDGNNIATATACNDAHESVMVINAKPPTPTVNVSVSPNQVHEGSNATFTIAALANVSQSTTVQYSMSGKATLGTDYTLNGTPGQATIAAGHSSTTVILHSLNDNLTEGNEPAIMTITASSKYTIGPNNKATLTIQDN